MLTTAIRACRYFSFRCSSRAEFGAHLHRTADTYDYQALPQAAAGLTRIPADPVVERGLQETVKQELRSLAGRARTLEVPGYPAVTGRLDDLDDADYPACTTGRAAGGARRPAGVPARLGAAGAVRPQRTAGGRRRCGRGQLAFAVPIRELSGQGRTLAAALRILALEDDPAAGRSLTARLHERPGGR